MLKTHELIRKCRTYLDESQLECAHGLCHCEAVARDAGTIVLVEGRSRASASP
jgi:L-lactate utilization protein LutB